MPHMDKFFRDLGETLRLFQEQNVKYTVIMYPLYRTVYHSYDPEEVQRFIDRLTEMTDFYDFTYTSVSDEPRYFYNAEQYRSDVGDMMIRKIFGREGYVPEDFGVYVKKGGTYSLKNPEDELLNKENNDSNSDLKNDLEFEKKIKVLIMHHINDEVYNSAVITEERLEELFEVISRNGYRVIRLSDIENFVKNGVELPEKPVLLTFDDGYLSNYTKVFPLLKKYQYSAVFFPIGVSIGKNEYKDTGKKIIPHYSLEQIKIMKDSGLVEFGTHGFDIHQSAKFETGRARESMVKFDDESEEEYIHFLKSDFHRFNQIFSELDLRINAMAYPLGEHNVLSDTIAMREGIELSFTTQSGDTFLLKGLYQSMFNMNRINIDMNVDLNRIFD